MRDWMASGAAERDLDNIHVQHVPDVKTPFDSNLNGHSVQVLLLTLTLPSISGPHKRVALYI